jgi:hypothetical protein
MNAIEKPTNQEFIDWFRDVWAEMIRNGDLNSDPLYILQKVIVDILWDFESVQDAMDFASVGNLNHYSSRGYPVSKSLVRTALYLWYDWTGQ